MATKITYHQILLAPCQAEGDEPSMAIIPHVKAGYCQVVNAEFTGGGGEKRFLLHVVTFEPVPEPDGS